LSLPITVAAQTVPFEILDGTPIAFTSVDVLPMDSETVLVDQTVVIEDGLIASIAPDSSAVIPSNATIIDGTDKFLFPGLADMHTHLGAEVPIAGGIGQNQVQVYLAAGVTTILNQGDFLSPFGRGLMSLRDAIVAGSTAGPTIYTASYARGQQDTGTNQQIVFTELDGRNHVLGSKAAGYDFIKIYNNTPLAAYQGIVDQARTENMAIMGHFPGPVGSATALADGMAMVSHAEAYFYLHFNFVQDTALILPAINQTLAAGTWVNTTLYIQETIAAIWGGDTAAFNAFLAQPQMQYVHPDEIAVWQSGFQGARWNPSGSQPGALDSRFAFVKNYTRAFHDAGIRLIAGTDSPTVLGAPGFSLHEEFRVISQLGLSNFEILKMATINPGEFIDQTLAPAKSFGLIRTGYRADILLLDSNPMDNLDNLRNAVGVLARGRWYSRASLDARLDSIAAEYAQPSAPPPSPPPTTSGGGGGAIGFWFVAALFAAGRIDRLRSLPTNPGAQPAPGIIRTSEPHNASSRNALRNIFPTFDFGKSSRNSIIRGRL
jgi:hypothetical protein